MWPGTVKDISTSLTNKSHGVILQQELVNSTSVRLKYVQGNTAQNKLKFLLRCSEFLHILYSEYNYNFILIILLCYLILSPGTLK